MRFTKAIRDALIDEVVGVQSKYLDSYTTFQADGPPKVKIKTQRLGPWLWVKSESDYGGATCDPSTDRLGGDPYSAHVFHDWIGLVKSAPKIVSHKEELNDWALIHTDYERQFTDVGVWGVHTGRWITNVTSEGIVTLLKQSNRRFQDVTPSSQTVELQVDLNRLREVSFDSLIDLIYDENEIIRELAIVQFGYLGDNRAVDPYLIEVADDESDYIREKAIAALGKLGGKKAIEKLISILIEREYHRVGPISALVRIGELTLPFLNPLISPDDEKLSNAVIQILEEIGGKQSLEILLKTMKEVSPPIRVRIIEALGSFDDERILGILVQELGSKDLEVQMEAIRSLEKLQDQPAVEPLVLLLLDENRYVRKGAIDALNSLGWKPSNTEETSWVLFASLEWEKLVKMGQSAADIILRALTDEDEHIRTQILETLRKFNTSFHDARAIEPILKIYYNESSNYNSRQDALWVLGTLQVPEAIVPLIHVYMTESFEYLGIKAYGAIHNLAESGFDIAETMIAMFVKWRVVKSSHDNLQRMIKLFSIVPVSLQQIKKIIPKLKSIVKSDFNKETSSIAKRLLKIDKLATDLIDEDHAKREKAAKALGKLELPSAAIPLLHALEGDAPFVREAAAYSLSVLSYPSLGTASLLLTAFDTENKIVRIGLAWVLGNSRALSVVGPLIKALRDRIPGVRQNAALSLGNFSSAKYKSYRGKLLKELVKLISKDKHLPVRLNAIYTLASFRDQRSVKLILSILFDPEMKVRLNASYALIGLSYAVRDPDSKLGRQIVDNLIQSLEDEVDEIRYNAAEALRMYGGAKALDAVTELLNDDDEYMRELAERGVKEIEELKGKKRRSWTYTARCKMKVAGPFDVEEIILLLKDRKESVRKRAQKALGKMDQLAYDRCLEILQDKEEHWRFREGAAASLGYMGDKRAMDVLIDALEDEHRNVRCEAAWSLAKLKDKRLVNALIKATKDKFWKVRRNASAGLGKIQGRAAFEVMLKLMEDEHPRVRVTTISYLGRFKSPRVIPALKKALKDEDAKVRGYAQQWLDYLATKKKSKK